MKQFTLRGLLLGIAGLLVITCSSVYVSLRMGALPWPTVFVTVLAMTVLGKAKNSSLQEINVTHTLMSSGAMVAGGLAFTLPGLWILNPSAGISTFQVLVFTVAGAVLGTVFSAFYRKNLIYEQKLVFPIGQSAYETLTTGISNGKQSVKLFAAMGASVVFTVFRDALGLFPAVVSFSNAGLWLSPMALAIGAVIGRLSAYLWLGGALIGLFIDDVVFKQSIGIGIMLGTGAGVLVKAAVNRIREGRCKGEKTKTNVVYLLATVLCVAFVLAAGTDLDFVQSLLTVAGIWVVTLLSGMLTGQSGINPMEVFGILVMLAISVFSKLSSVSMFVIAGTTAVACGLCGDVMNDLKSGSMLGTDPSQQILAEGVGGVIGAVVSVAVLFALRNRFGNFGGELLPAPQATAVAAMAGGFGNTKIILAGAALGFVLFLAGIPASTLGLGIYLANYISFAVGLGAVLANGLKRFAKVRDRDVNLVSSGLLGGEGIAGVVIAIISTMTGGI